MKNLIDKAKTTHDLTRDEIISILKDDSINEYLFSVADKVRKEYIGDEVYLRALIEFSNICRCNCAYCGIRRDNENVKRFRLTKDEILSLANLAIQSGYKTLVLQSGEDAYFSAEYLAEIVKAGTYDAKVNRNINFTGIPENEKEEVVAAVATSVEKETESI